MSPVAEGFTVGLLPVFGGVALGTLMGSSDPLKMKLCVLVIVAVILSGAVVAVAS